MLVVVGLMALAGGINVPLFVSVSVLAVYSLKAVCQIMAWMPTVVQPELAFDKPKRYFSLRDRSAVDAGHVLSIRRFLGL